MERTIEMYNGKVYGIEVSKNDMVNSIRYALERLDHARLHFIKKKEN